MVAAVCLVESFPSHMPALGRLATDVLAGAASYTATILLFFRSRLVALRAVFTGTDSAVTVLTEGADLNVPVRDGKISDVTRIERLSPTIRELAGKGAKVRQ